MYICVIQKKMVEMNLFTKQKQRHRLENKYMDTNVGKGERGGTGRLELIYIHYYAQCEFQGPLLRCFSRNQSIRINKSLVKFKGFSGGSVAKNLPTKEGDTGLIPGSGRSTGDGNATHSSILTGKYSMGKGAWWAIVHGVAKMSDTIW